MTGPSGPDLEIGARGHPIGVRGNCRAVVASLASSPMASACEPLARGWKMKWLSESRPRHEGGGGAALERMTWLRKVLVQALYQLTPSELKLTAA